MSWTMVPRLWYFVVYCSDRDQILVQCPVDQQHCMQSNNWNRIYIVRGIRFPSGGSKFGKVCVIMIRGSTCSKHILLINLRLFKDTKKSIWQYSNCVMIVSFVSHLQVPGHLFAHESPCISKYKEIIWDLSLYLGVSSASKHTHWSFPGW